MEGEGRSNPTFAFAPICIHFCGIACYDSFEVELYYFVSPCGSIEKRVFNYTTFDNGSLGSRIDEERSELR